MKKFGGVLSILLVAGFAAGLAVASSKNNAAYAFVRGLVSSLRSTDTSENDHWRTKVDEFRQFEGHADIVMVGDSLVENAQWQELFPEVSIINRGISGDGVDGVLLRLDQITAATPRMVFIMLGVNDIRAYTDAEQVAASYGKIITRLAAVNEVIVQSTLFTTSETKNNAAIRRLNEGLVFLCSKAPNCRFLDLKCDPGHKRPTPLGFHA
ncbi:GDSL-type esterase/lipase family protein [Mesorhizobium sp. M0213]|uniref:GDSL-type esterase/lipase family protein n=1 Tax=Mesorhizobium sp. M0213 TaxID=2956917 RepID=UPI003334F0F8